MIRAAGILIVCNGEMLFIKRGAGSDHAGEWCIPGGKIDDGETSPEAAVRETFEEVGVSVPIDAIAEWTRTVSDEVDFTTFIGSIREQPEITLQVDEADAFEWRPLNDPPQPLHPGLEMALARFNMDELSVAEAMSLGKLASPSVYQNLTLFNIRITGTGLSYRIGHDEFVWREPSIYLNQRFLKRCNGLPVIWEHPEGTVLDSEEFDQRIVGTVFLPFVPDDKPDDVWAIVKIYNDNVIQALITDPYSTSPSVTLRKGANVLSELDGDPLLIEGTPALIDHIALCCNGVWDKGGPPNGVDSADIIRADSEECPLPINYGRDNQTPSIALGAAFALGVAVATKGIR